MTQSPEQSKLTVVTERQEQPQATVSQISATNDSTSKQSSNQVDNAETFSPPTPTTDLSSLTDGRQPGEFPSRYPAEAWWQIAAELMYLIFLLLGSTLFLFLLARHVVQKEQVGFIATHMGVYPGSSPLVIWATIALSGACGGCATSLKWLYHSVAKRQWNRDRVIWRIVVPVLSATVALFLGMMIVSGIVPFLNKTSLTNPLTGAAFGFFVGFFSDNVLAALQKLAFQVFGTVDSRSSPQKDPN